MPTGMPFTEADGKRAAAAMTQEALHERVADAMTPEQIHQLGELYRNCPGVHEGAPWRLWLKDHELQWLARRL